VLVLRYLELLVLSSELDSFECLLFFLQHELHRFVQLLVEHSVVEHSFFPCHRKPLGFSCLEEFHQLDQELLGMGSDVSKVSAADK